MEVVELTQKFTDMELVALRKDERDAVIHTFGVPPEQLGIVTNSNRATAHESESIMATSVLVPRLEAMREQLQDELVPVYDPRLILHYVSPVPDDDDYRLEVMSAAPYMFKRGEWRSTAGFQDRGSGDDVHLQPLNLYEVPAPEPDTPQQMRARYGGLGCRGSVVSLVSLDLTEGMIPRVLDHLEPDRIKAEIEPVWGDELEKWGQRALDDLGVDVTFNMLNPLVVSHMESVTGERIKLIDETTRKDLTEQLIEGVREGEGVDKLTKRVQGVFDNRKFEAERIARTETVRSSSFAAEEAWKQAALVWGKQWLAAPDSERHGELNYDGVIAPLGRDFVFPDGNRAPHPGGFGDPAHDINCQCIMIPVPEEPPDWGKAVSPTDQWRDVNSRRLVWERIAKAAYRRGFDAQERDILKILRKLSV